jgi:glyoxylase-like metal-dependent hydrolase (beta-lactamase superfamily II)
MKIQHFFDPDTFTLTYVVFDEKTKDALVIDPVLDIETASGKLTETSTQKVLKFLKDENLKPHFVLETHAHADHLSSSQLFKKHYPGIKVGVSERIKAVQEVFKGVFNLTDFSADGSDFDYLIQDNEVFSAGSIKILALPTPGHTPACTSFVIENNVFTGDALFMPDYGTGRCDFPMGSAAHLYDSVQRLYAMPEDTKVYVGHDYQPEGRELRFQTTIGESKASNIQLKASTSKSDYVSFREARDKTLKAPRLLLPSLQVNIAAGKLPRPENNGMSYLKLPLKVAY